MHPFLEVPGHIAQGHRVASGLASDSPYPDGSIKLQIPHFRQRGLDLSAYYPATLNIDITPQSFELMATDHTFATVDWIDAVPPETFSFSHCKLMFKGDQHAGFIYYPHPETKVQHFHNPTIIEVIIPYIPTIQYGDKVSLLLNPKHIRLNSI